MKNAITFLFISILFTVSCIEDPQLSAEEAGLQPVGSWSNLTYNENGMTMEKVSQLKENTYGYRFLSNGKLIHRANSGFCGTPPIVTSDFDGTWTKNGEIIKIEAAFWGGTSIVEWKIISTNDNKLAVEVLKSEWEMDE
jgi:hypothetical protein